MNDFLPVGSVVLFKNGKSQYQLLVIRCLL